MRAHSSFDAVIVVFIAVTAGSSLVHAQARLKVAIYPFDQSTVQTNIQKEVGGNINYGQVAADMLVTELSQNLDIINRDQMKKILEEQGHKYDERFDKSQAGEFGKLLGVDAIITGSITSLHAEQQTSGGLGKALGSLSKKAPKLDKSSTTVTVGVEIMAEAISTVTGKTLASARDTGTVKKSTSSKIEINNQSSGGDTSSKSGYDPYIRDAISNADKQIGAEFAGISSAPRIGTAGASAPAPASAPPSASQAAAEYAALPDEVGNVGKVQGDTIVFFVAPGAHIAVGDTLEVQHPEMIKNPRTGKTVATGETLGTVKVISVSSDQGRGTYNGKAATDQDRLVKKPK